MSLFHLSRKHQQKLRIFAVSLGVSIIAWCVFALSNKYFYRVSIPVQYVNSPENKAFHPLQSDTVSLNVEGSGWQILFSQLRLQSQSFKVDLSGLKNRNWVMFSTQLNYLNNQIPGNQRIISVSPDTLYFDFSKQTVKRVPVQLKSELSFRKRYNIVDSIVLKPAYVTVTGPSADLIDIQKWDTELLVRKDIEGNIKTLLGLAKKEKGNLTIYPANVEVNIPVGETTEKILEIPVRMQNAQRGVSTTLLPSKVKLTVSVPLQYYADMNREAFQATVDLEASKFKTSSLPIVITKSPDYSTILKIEPQNVDYIIRK